MKPQVAESYLVQLKKIHELNSEKLRNDSKLKWAAVMTVVGLYFYCMPPMTLVLGNDHLIFGLVLSIVQVIGAIFFVDIFYTIQRLVTQSTNFSVPPGNILLVQAEFLFSKRFYVETCTPIILDMREEYFEAVSQNRIGKARWVRFRGTYSFFAAIGLDRAFAFVSFFIKAWKSVN